MVRQLRMAKKDKKLIAKDLKPVAKSKKKVVKSQKKEAKKKEKKTKPILKSKKKIAKSKVLKDTSKPKKKKVVKKTSKTKSSDQISLRDLLEAGCHFGHKKSKTHPKVKQYIYTVRDGVAIFDLAKTKQGLESAKKFVSGLVKKGGKIAFVGTKRQAKEVVREEAKRVDMPYVTSRWLGGTITNWEEIKTNSIDKLNRLKKEWDEGKFKKRPKKEQSVIRRELARLERIVGGLSGLDKLFDAVFVVDVKAEATVIREAKGKKIPIVAIVDSNGNPAEVDYPICANDDAAKSIQFLVEEIGKAIKS